MNDRKGLWGKGEATAKDQNLPVMTSFCVVISSFRGRWRQVAQPDRYIPSQDPISRDPWAWVLALWKSHTTAGRQLATLRVTGIVDTQW